MPRAEIVKRFRFSASHFLPNHGGACRNLHGHNFFVAVHVEGEIDTEEGSPTEGMVIEFDALKPTIRRLEARLDHAHLNDSLPPRFRPGTTENGARFILDEFQADGIDVKQVEVEETPSNSAIARP
jgi:6-pyruvoyl tetrahydropterin synthase/QueD family protein